MGKAAAWVTRRLETFNTVLVNIIILGLGLIVVLAGIIVQSPEYKNILISVGCSLMASAVVSFLALLYLKRSDKIRMLVDHWGLEAIYATRQEMNRSTDIAFQSLENHLDIIGWGMKSFRDGKGDIVREKVKRGLKIRILAPDPESSFVRQREKDEKEVDGQIRKTILDLALWVGALKGFTRNPNDVRIRFYTALPEDFYFRVDNALFLGPYLYGKSSQQTISYEFRGPSEGFAYYQGYFDRLWDDESFCRDPGEPEVLKLP